MKTICSITALFTAALLWSTSAHAGGWSSVTLSDMKSACYGTTSEKNLTKPCDPARGCLLFADPGMRASCKAWHDKVASTCRNPAPNSCPRATACVDARKGTDNYFSSSGVGGINKMISRWGGNMQKLGVNLRKAMQNPTVIRNHKEALQTAINQRQKYCGS